MTTSQNGRSLIESFEGLRTVAYQDQRGIWSCGFGHTQGVTSDTICTFEQADEWLSADLATAEHCVTRMVKVPIGQKQFDALVSLTFNIGCGNFSESTVLRKLNMRDYLAAADAFQMWNKINGEESAGLTSRRTSEMKMFLTEIGEVDARHN